MVTSRDFWLSCGHHLLDRNAAGRLLVTDEFLKAYLARPELMPPPEACTEEQALHRALLREPLRSRLCIVRCCASLGCQLRPRGLRSSPMRTHARTGR